MQITKRKGIIEKKKVGASFKLPDIAATPLTSVHSFTYLIHGEPKIGKSTFLSQFDDVYFMFFEPGGKSIPVRQSYIPDWKTALKALAALEANPNYCSMIVIDTGFMAYQRCMEFVLEKMGIDSARDSDWGTAWTAIDTEFKSFHDRIFALGKGFAVTAHSELVTIKKKNGLENTKIKTQLSKQAWRFYNGVVDLIGYYEYDVDGNRVLVVRGSSDIEAGCRLIKSFRYTDGTRMEEIPMGDDETESYTNFMKAFNNEFENPNAKKGDGQKRRSIVRKRK